MMAVQTARPPTLAMEKDKVRIGYVLKRYPRLSETFIVQEILQMERRGMDLVVFAIMDPHEPIQNTAVTNVRAPVIYLQRSLTRDMAAMTLDPVRLALSSPSRYRAAVRHLLHSSRSRASLRAFLQAGRLARLAQKQGVTHLHAHFAHNPTSLARYASQMTGIPFSFTAHAKDLYLARPGSLVNKAELASFITTCTSFNAQYLTDILGPQLASKVHTVYHGVDTERFSPPKERSNNPVPVLLSVGRLVPKKGYEHLVRAAEILRERGHSFRLEIYGGGDLEDTLRRQIAAADLSKMVHLRGSCTQDELIPMYHTADIFVLAPTVTQNGDRDGIPNVLLEAMACGLPVVSTDISGIPELIVNGESGMLVPSEDPCALANALEALLESSDLRSRLRRCARETVCRHFDACDNAGAMASLLLERRSACASPTF